MTSRDAAKARAFADRIGLTTATATDDLDALLRSGAVDAVYIASPNGAHAAQARTAIAAGRLAQGAPLPRPAPLYLRPADAAPPRDAPPVLLA